MDTWFKRIGVGTTTNLPSPRNSESLTITALYDQQATGLLPYLFTNLLGLNKSLFLFIRPMKTSFTWLHVRMLKTANWKLYNFKIKYCEKLNKQKLTLCTVIKERTEGSWLNTWMVNVAYKCSSITELYITPLGQTVTENQAWAKLLRWLGRVYSRIELSLNGLHSLKWMSARPDLIQI